MTDKNIDIWYNIGIKNGAIGGKLVGAGGGGFILFFAEPEAQERLKKKFKSYLHVPFNFESSGSQIIYYGPHDKFT